ncbi:hypothetical protein [uncultured Formosa sp.]|uniref:hypothetical protein n=1 Tax=uncultured Formosa sp. TaxID=255435 RepID=UPI002601CA4C|nr:hypothetical protein [uncultured Formosa sp.]
MNQKQQLGKNIASLLLFMALMLPTAVKFVHIFEGHQHFTCTEQKTHLHTSVTKCEICSFHLASFKYDIVEYPDLLLTEVPLEMEVNFTPLQLHSFSITNTQLRAPPIFS